MRLISFEITGFRGYSTMRRIDFDALTTLVGKNDAGKSSLMDSLDLFFGDSKLEKEDLCVHERHEKVVLAAEFLGYPANIVLDDTSVTSLAEERLLLLKQGHEPVLRIIKEFLPGKAAEIALEVSSPHIPEITHPILLKQAELKAFCRKNGLEASISPELRNRNPPWRGAIFDAYSSAATTTIKVPISKDEAKAIWDKLRTHIPHFCLFKVDRASTDQDSEARDPLAAAAKIAVSEREAEINAIVVGVQARATELVSRTLDKLREMAPELAVGLEPDISGQPKWDGFKTTLKTDGNVPFNKRGSGTKRLVLLNFFRAEAERRSITDNRGIIYAFEEPESSQHPENQRLLLDSFKRLASSGTSQVILTTHSPLVAQNVPVSSLRLISKIGLGACPSIDEAREDSDGLLTRIASELGIRPDRRTVALVLVEGPNDVNFLEKIFPAVREIDENVINLADSPLVSVVPVGGSDLKHWVTKKYLKGLNCAEYHIFDRDCGPEEVPHYQAQVDAVNAADDDNTARLTQKRETENYLHPDAIKAGMNINVQFGDFDDVPRLVSEASRNTTLSPDLGQSSAKRLLNTLGAGKMTAQMLRERDPNGEIIGWFREITDLVRRRTR